MKEVGDEVTFSRDYHDAPVIVAAITASTGTAQLQLRAGEDPGSTWVDVADGLISNANGTLTIWAPRGTLYRFNLTGDAKAYVSVQHGV